MPAVGCEVWRSTRAIPFVCLPVLPVALAPLVPAMGPGPESVPLARTYSPN